MKITDRRLLKPVVEFIILTAAGLTAVIGGLHLERTYRPKGVYDRIGAGNFLFGIGIALLLVAGAYLYSELKHYRSLPDLPLTSGDDSEKRNMMDVIVTVGLNAMNIFLIPILGYLVPGILFFVLNFTIFKLTKSQLLNVFIGVCIGIAFFAIFTHALGMFFPSGLFGLDFGVK